MKVCDSKFHQCIYFASQALARKVEKLAVECWQPVGLSPSHAYVLVLVLESPGIQPMEISQQLQLTPSTITRLAEKLEARGLLIRHTSGKESHWYPTAEATQLQPAMQQCMGTFRARYATIRAAVPPDDLVHHICNFADQLE